MEFQPILSRKTGWIISDFVQSNLIIRYGNFFQFVLPTSWGHVSVCIEKDADPVALGLKVKALFKNEMVDA